MLQCAEMALKELLTPLSLPLTVLSSASLVLYISLFRDFFSAPDPPALSRFSYICFLSSLPPTKVPSFSPCHEMAAKGLSVWFLLSADPISKGPGDPALAPALLLSSPNSPQT